MKALLSARILYASRLGLSGLLAYIFGSMILKCSGRNAITHNIFFEFFEAIQLIVKKVITSYLVKQFRIFISRVSGRTGGAALRYNPYFNRPRINIRPYFDGSEQLHTFSSQTTNDLPQ